MRLALLAFVAFPAFNLALVQDPGPEEELERLAETIDSVEAFTARYSLFIDGEEAGGMELTYLAPDCAALKVTEEGKSTFMWCADGIVTTLYSSPGDTQWFQIDVAAANEEVADVHNALYKQFDELEETADGEISPVLHLHFEDDDGEGPWVKWMFNAQTGPQSIFCWYGEHRALWREVALEPDHLVFRAQNEGVMRIARGDQAGFPVSASAPTEKGQFELRLVTLELEVDEALLEIPDRPDKARDLSEDSSGLVDGVRTNVHRQVAALLADGRVEWDDSTRDRLSIVLEALHRHWLPAHYDEWIQGRRDASLLLADWVLKGIDNDVDEDDLREEVAVARKTFEETLKRMRDAYADNLSAPVEGEWAEQVLLFEQEVARDLYEETVAQPLIEFFETEVEGLL